MSYSTYTIRNAKWPISSQTIFFFFPILNIIEVEFKIKSTFDIKFLKLTVFEITDWSAYIHGEKEEKLKIFVCRGWKQNNPHSKGTHSPILSLNKTITRADGWGKVLSMRCDPLWLLTN